MAYVFRGDEDFRVVPEAWNKIDTSDLLRMYGAFEDWCERNMDWLPEHEKKRAKGMLYAMHDAYVLRRNKEV